MSGVRAGKCRVESLEVKQGDTPKEGFPFNVSPLVTATLTLWHQTYCDIWHSVPSRTPAGLEYDFVR